MDLRIGLWQIIELSFLVFVIYKGTMTHGNRIWKDEDLNKAVDEKRLPFLIKTVAGIEVIFWFFVIGMGGLAGWAMLLYVITSMIVFVHQTEYYGANYKTATINVYGIIFRQIVFQSILITGGFYTQAPLINF